jgi:hypothetical protein
MAGIIRALNQGGLPPSHMAMVGLSSSGTGKRTAIIRRQIIIQKSPDREIVGVVEVLS